MRCCFPSQSVCVRARACVCGFSRLLSGCSTCDFAGSLAADSTTGLSICYFLQKYPSLAHLCSCYDYSLAHVVFYDPGTPRNSVVGWAAFSPEGLACVCVRRSYQRQGVGTRLIEAVASVIEGNIAVAGTGTAVLQAPRGHWPAAPWAAAMPFFESVGFKLSDSRTLTLALGLPSSAPWKHTTPAPQPCPKRRRLPDGVVRGACKHCSDVVMDARSAQLGLCPACACDLLEALHRQLDAEKARVRRLELQLEQLQPGPRGVTTGLTVGPMSNGVATGLTPGPMSNGVTPGLPNGPLGVSSGLAHGLPGLPIGLGNGLQTPHLTDGPRVVATGLAGALLNDRPTTGDRVEVFPTLADRFDIRAGDRQSQEVQVPRTPVSWALSAVAAPVSG